MTCRYCEKPVTPPSTTLCAEHALPEARFMASSRTGWRRVNPVTREEGKARARAAAAQAKATFDEMLKRNGGAK